jgi:hypothetical protein
MKLDDLELMGLLVCLFVLSLCLAAWAGSREKQNRPKPNIRVPRETLWERTRRIEASRGR